MRLLLRVLYRKSEKHSTQGQQHSGDELGKKSRGRSKKLQKCFSKCEKAKHDKDETEILKILPLLCCYTLAVFSLFFYILHWLYTFAIFHPICCLVTIFCAARFPHILQIAANHLGITIFPMLSTIFMLAGTY